MIKIELLGKYVETIDHHKGIVIKQYKPTGRILDSVHIKQEDGQIWFCPVDTIIYVKEMIKC